MKVGVFDSGIGGLTVLRKLIEKYPNNDYIYYGDTINIGILTEINPTITHNSVFSIFKTDGPKDPKYHLNKSKAAEGAACC